MKFAILLFSAILLLVFSQTAAAYLDPGSGSMLLQVILGGAAAIMLAVKLMWHRILAIFGKKGKESNQ